MKFRTVESENFLDEGRLDSWYYLSPANIALALMKRAKRKGINFSKLSEIDTIVKVWTPKRNKQAIAVDEERSSPYLQPYDLFNYLPEPNVHVSINRTKDFNSYQLETGMIMQTCSGRNLGPSTIVDQYLCHFIVSNDMIRIEIEDPRIRNYAFAFLNCSIGQSLLRRGKTGSVIDHLSEKKISEIEIPLLDEESISKISSKISKAIRLREKSRLDLKESIAKYEGRLPSLKRDVPLCNGWTMPANLIGNRLDSAFHDPIVSNIRTELGKNNGLPVDAVAKVIKPVGRYKTNYVDEKFGRPLLSGRQLLQSRPINLKFMSPSVFNRVEDYELHMGWIAYQADGRVEGALGNPVLISSERERWLASGHIGRVVPNEDVDTSWLFASLKTKHSQIQIKSRASGSVVDGTYSEDMENVILPSPDLYKGLNQIEIWEGFAQANHYEREAISLIETELANT